MSEIDLSKLRKLGHDEVHTFDEGEWGYPQTLYVGKPSDFASTTRSLFRAAVRLRPANGYPRQIDLADATIDNILDGDSNFFVPEDARTTQLTDDAGREIIMNVQVNAEGRVAAFTWPPFAANGLMSAMRDVNAMLSRLALLYPTTTGVPLVWDVVVVERAEKPVSRSVTMHVGYPTVNLPNGFTFGGRTLGMIDFFGPHLAEGLRSQSPFWRVLCYYKVARFYYNGLAKRLGELRHERGLEPMERRRLPDAVPFTTIAVDLIGKSYGNIVDSLRSQYRNVFAHFTTDEVMSPLDAHDEEMAAASSAVLKRIAFDALTDVRKNVSDLMASGVSVAEIETLIAQTNEAERHHG